MEAGRRVLRKKEIKEHPDVRKGLEAPFPENATADVLLSHPPYFSSAKLICYQRQRHSSPTDPQCASLLVSYRLPVLIARLRPNADSRKPMKTKVKFWIKKGPVTSWHRLLRHVPTCFVTRERAGFRQGRLNLRAAFQDVESKALLEHRPERRFRGADKSAHELAINQWRDCVHVHALAR